MIFMRKILRFLLFAVLAVIFVLAAMNIFVPVYVFDDPQPFHGEYLHNPYQNMDSTAWKRCIFHGHTERYGGLTNGRDISSEVYDSMYRSFGYDHVGISDYNIVNDFEKDDEGYIPGYEHGYNLWKIHQLCLGTEKVRHVDYFFGQTLSMKQHTINKLGEQNVVACVAHPAFVKNSYRVKDMKYLSNYRIMEALNGYDNSPEHWDMALSNGHLVYLIADDDTHNPLKSNDIGLRITYLNAKENKAGQFLDALLSGNAYGVDFEKIADEDMDEKRIRFERDMPYLTKADLDGTRFSVRVTKPIENAQFIGQGGMVLKEENHIPGDSVFETSYNIKPADTYVRTVVDFGDGSSLWLNPITRHESETIVYQRLDHISWLWTAALWMAYVLLIAVIVKIFKNSTHNNKK